MRSSQPAHAIQEPLDQFRALEDYLHLQASRLAEIYDRLEGRDTANQCEASPPVQPAEAFPPGLVGAFKRSHSNCREHVNRIEALIGGIAAII